MQSFCRTYLRILAPGLALWLLMIAVLWSASARSASYPHVALKDKTWHCTSLQKHTQVDVEIDSPVDKLNGVSLDAGCTGVIRVAVDTNSGDGIKVHQGAHDLEVWGYVNCTGKTSRVHQDGIQAQGGGDPDHPGHGVTFKWVKVDCPTGNNGGLFAAGGAGGSPGPFDVVCAHCNLFERNAALNIGASSTRSGARDSILRTGNGSDTPGPSSPRDCVRLDKTAVDPVDTGNRCLTPR